MFKQAFLALLLLAFCFTSIEAATAKANAKTKAKVMNKKARVQESLINCNVQFITPNGDTCENVQLANTQKTLSNQFLWNCNDQVSEVRVTGKCPGCSVVLFEDSNFQGRKLGYNINNKRVTYLKNHYFADREGNVQTQWDRMLSGYQLYCL